MAGCLIRGSGPLNYGTHCAFETQVWPLPQILKTPPQRHLHGSVAGLFAGQSGYDWACRSAFVAIVAPASCTSVFVDATPSCAIAPALCVSTSANEKATTAIVFTLSSSTFWMLPGYAYQQFQACTLRQSCSIEVFGFRPTCRMPIMRGIVTGLQASERPERGRGYLTWMPLTQISGACNPHANINESLDDECTSNRCCAAGWVDTCACLLGTLCYGEDRGGCDRYLVAGTGRWRGEHISCYSDIAKIALSWCGPNKVKSYNIHGNRRGGRCGYAYVTIECAD